MYIYIYIDDLAVDLRCDVKLFAYDTPLFTVVGNASDAAAASLAFPTTVNKA